MVWDMTDRLLDAVIENPKRGIAELMALCMIPFSRQTVMRALNEFGFYTRVARRKFFLREENRVRRLDFAVENMHWSKNEWRHCIFMDEKSFYWRNNYRVLLRRQVGEEAAYEPPNISVIVPDAAMAHNHVYVKFWACVCPVLNLFLIRRYTGNMTGAHYLDILQWALPQITARRFQMNIAHHGLHIIHDNVNYHRGQAVINYIDTVANVALHPWPPQAQDWNIIENVFSLLATGVRSWKSAVNEAPSGPNQFWDLVQAEWDLISERADYAENLANSIPQRLLECIQNDGYFSKY